MATYKTPEELRAWSRSFYNKSKVIKRGFYNYVTPEDGELNSKNDDEKQSQDNEVAVKAENEVSNEVSDDASLLASSIIAKGNASTSDIDALFSLDSSTIDEMNSKFPTTEEQLSQAKVSAENNALRRSDIEDNSSQDVVLGEDAFDIF